MLGRSLAEVEAREAEAARSAAAPTPLHPRPQTSHQPPPSARLLLQVQREADGFARQLQMEQTIAALEAEATRAQAEHCAVRARAEERERELLGEAATARDEVQRAQEAAAEEKRRQQRHLRRVQVHTGRTPSSPARPHARAPARPHARSPARAYTAPASCRRIWSCS